MLLRALASPPLLVAYAYQSAFAPSFQLGIGLVAAIALYRAVRRLGGETAAAWRSVVARTAVRVRNEE
jgi:hypothetical protein